MEIWICFDKIFDVIDCLNVFKKYCEIKYFDKDDLEIIFCINVINFVWNNYCLLYRFILSSFNYKMILFGILLIIIIFIVLGFIIYVY